MKTALRSLYSYIIEKSGYRLEATLEETDDSYLFSIDSPMNDTGILYRIAAVLFVNGWDIYEADVKTPVQDRIQDTFQIIPVGKDHPADSELIKKMMKELEELLFGSISVVDYLSSRNLSVTGEGGGTGFADLTYDNGKVVIEIISDQRKWLLLGIFQAFYLMDVNIKEASIAPLSDGTIKNRFIIATEDFRYHNPEFRKRLREELKSVI